MGIANEQILSHLSIESIPKSVANGGVTTAENEAQSDRLSNHDDYYTAIRGGAGGEINEKIGKPLTFNNYSCK
jgi:hypothetical protein